MDIQQKEKRFPSAAGNCDIRVRYWIPEEIRGAMDERGISVFLSEQAAARIARILTVCVAILTLPFLVLAIMI